MLAGVSLDSQSRCAHWHAHWDVVAIRLPCCAPYWACIDCHQELADHPPQIWRRDQLDEPAVLCGACGTQHKLSDYLQVYQQDAPPACPTCQHPWNPGCRNHLHNYVQLP